MHWQIRRLIYFKVMVLKYFKLKRASIFSSSLQETNSTCLGKEHRSPYCGSVPLAIDSKQ